MPENKPPLSQKLDIPDIKVPDTPQKPLQPIQKPEEPKKKSDVPVTLSWGNVENLWREIKQARDTKNPEQWEAVTRKVHDALEDWKKVINRWPDMARKYKLVQAIADRAEDEKKQEALDTLQKIRDVMPVHIRRAIDAGQAIVPLKARAVEDLVHSLEGIRQGDYDAYAGPVKRELAHWEETQMDEQHKLRKQIRDFRDRLDGIQDEDRRKKFHDRLQQIETRKKQLSNEIDSITDKARQDKLTDTISDYTKESKSIMRRLTGTKDPDARARLNVKINELEMGLKTPERIKEEMRSRAKDAKYDALLWLVTNIAHPEKVLKTKGPIQAQPIKPKYMPPEETMAGEEEVETEPQKPEASECRIFLSMINEGLFDKAKAFWSSPFVLTSGDLVILEDNKKGRIQAIDSIGNKPVVVDVFNENITISIGLGQLQKYM